MRNPIKRVFAFCGLLFLAPVAYQLYQGRITMMDAGLKSGATLLAVLFATRIALWGLDLMAGQMERASRPAMNRRVADRER
jgi:hypothetical protein